MKRKEIIRAGMADWFDPVSLARTGYEVFISNIFGQHADRRLMENLADTGGLRERLYYDFSDLGDKDFWFDYIADVGDGFNSTYTMAYHLSRPTLELRSPDPARPSYETEAGRILIFGGDEVYPVGDKALYNERLVVPYKTAFPAKKIAKDEPPDDTGLPAVFAVPGNHDWYDGLASFFHIFCEQHKFGGWQTMQNRSYFALKLPRGWWLFGTDMQLGSALDKPQMEYFGKLMDKVGDNERIILCNAEPNWSKGKLHANDPGFSNRNMGFFEGHVLRRHKVAIYIAGDSHYYRRHEEILKTDGSAKDDPRQKITAGGGGAFLHPTHKQDLAEVGKIPPFKLCKSFPDERVCSRLCWWNLLFPLWNPWFGLLTGALALLTAKAFLSDLRTFKLSQFDQALMTVFRDALIAPFAIFWVLFILLGFMFFTRSPSWPYRITAGLLHGLAHLLIVFFTSWWVSYYLSGGNKVDFTVGQLLLGGLLIFIGGWIAGSFIMGFYLLISLNFFGRHHNEAFSALKIEDYKNFVRFKIEENGDLLIFPIGVRRVTKKWKENPPSIEPRIVPEVEPDEKDKPFLIEDPIRFRKLFTAAAAQTDGKSKEKMPDSWRRHATPIE